LTHHSPKILTVVGARPQFIKAAPVSAALARAGVDEILLHTGQHYDDKLSAIFFRELDLAPPTYSLDIGSGSHAVQTGRMMAAIEDVVQDIRPDRVLVYGDTNSTLAGALVAAKCHIPIDHVEAGLRSFNRRMPEEINRVLTDHMSDLLFAPTEGAIENLVAEGIDGERVKLTGDVMFDATLAARERALSESSIIGELGLTDSKYILATVHRAENTDDPERITRILDALAAVSRDLPVVLPLHPRTRAKLQAMDLDLPRDENFMVIEPLGYHDLTRLEADAAMIATDSGGVQKEAFFHGVSCVTLRSETEWTELVDLDWNVIADPAEDDIAGIISDRIGHVGREGSPYGEGKASDAIAANICRELNSVNRMSSS